MLTWLEMNLCGALLPLFFAVMKCSPTITSNISGGLICEEQDVVLNCSVIGTGRLTWIIGSADPSSDNTILFKVADISTLTTLTDSTGQFTASIIHYSINEDISILGNLSSTLHTRVNSSLTNSPITISCSDGYNMIPSYSLTLVGPPSPPQNVTVEVVYGVSEYSLIVQWNSPRDDEGVYIRYFLSLYYNNIIERVLFVSETRSLSQTFLLNYSMGYSLTLTASNCAGTSSSVSLTSAEAGCRAPVATVGVIIEEYSSTEEGAVIQFHCQNRYHPTEWVTSQCINSSWSPDPLVCEDSVHFKTKTMALPSLTPSNNIPDQNHGVCAECVKSSIAIIIGVVCSVVFLSVGVLLGVMGLYLIQRVRRKFSASSSSSSPSPLPPPVNYEEVGVVREVKHSQDIKLTINEAYSPITH